MKKEELLKGLSKEQIEKARACHDSEELLALAKEEGVELNDEQLAAVAGGNCTPAPSKTVVCPQCNSTQVKWRYDDYMDHSNGGFHCVCGECGYSFDVLS